MLSKDIPQTATAFGFVLCLTGVGMVSHLHTEPVQTSASAVTGAWQTGYEDAFAAANPLEATATHAFGALRYAMFRQGSEGVLVGQNGWLFTAEEFETSPQSAAQTTAAAGYVAKVVQQLAAQGIQVLPVLVPDKAEVYAQHLRHTRPAEVQQRRAQFQQALVAKGIQPLDATPPLLKAAQTGSVFMRTDTHWSPHGSHSVAQAIAEFAATEARLPSAHSPVRTASTGVGPFEGDLLPFVPTGALRPLIGPAPETIEHYETSVQASGGLFDAPAAPVVLVGTSFSARTDFHFEGFLKQALQTDVINYASEGQGPFAPMARFLATETLRTSPPELVIWEIPLRYVSKDLLP